MFSLVWLATNSPVEIWRGDALSDMSRIAVTSRENWPVDPASGSVGVYQVRGGMDVRLVIATPLDPVRDQFAEWTTNRVGYPYDPLYSREDYQWYLRNTGQSSKLFYDGICQEEDTGTNDAGIADGWSIATNPGARGIRIGIADLGCDWHEDLDGAIIAGRDFVTSDSQNYADAQISHGTALATLIAARRGNGLGISGVAFESHLLIARTSCLGRDTQQITAAAIRWCANHGAKVIYVGGGTPIDNAPLSNACWYAVSAGAAIVCSVPNSPVSMDSGSLRDFPTSWRMPGVLSVTCGTRDGKLYGWSAWGTNVLVVPGRVIVSGMGTNDYGYFSGSSPAGAIAAGMLAILRAQFPHLSPAELVDRVKHRATPLPGTAGYANLKSALDH